MSAKEPTSSVYSNADSGFYSASECSTPPTPSQPSRHFRFPSSTSSLSSSPPTHDAIEPPSSSGKLPKLTEEPVERNYSFGDDETCRCSCKTRSAVRVFACVNMSIDDLAHDGGHTQECLLEKAYDPESEYYTNYDTEIRLAKRRRSLEASAHSIAGKFERRFPSLSRKVRDRSSTLSRVSRSATPSRVPSTRSSSLAGSHQASAIDLGDSLSPVSTSALASTEEAEDDHTTPMQIDVAKANAMDMEIDPEQVDAERYATTPLLPPLLVDGRDNDLPTSSPLQSPTVADATHSLLATPVGTPAVRAYPTPPLSSKPSVASLKGLRAGHQVPSSDIPPMMLADPNDKWANKLGHANFTILPEPYIPQVCKSSSVEQLFSDWSQARNNYAKHQVRTAEHYGATSKHYLLTEQKWAEIDAEWRKNHDLAKSLATVVGQEREPTSPTEPEPLSKMPTLNDPKSQGKFPKLGDEDIVGPMLQEQAKELFLQKPPSRKRAFFKFLSDLRFPGTFLGRSSDGVRSH